MYRSTGLVGQTDRGKIRVNNEDSFLGLQFDAEEVHHLGKIGTASLEKTDFVFAVSDGMGGAKAGEFASRVTVEKITLLMPRAFKQAASGLEVGFPDLLTELFDQIHRALIFLGRSYEECNGMGATLSLCWFTPGWMYFGHIGDSRIYYFSAREGGMNQISHDDTHVGWLYRKGLLNEREARNHPRRFFLQKALGAGHQFTDPQLGAIAYEKGDQFLLCTDGLTEGLYDHQIQELVQTPEHLVSTSVRNSGRDNTTALTISIS